jgi:predicted metal-dependent phosphoesterase TrpH
MRNSRASTGERMRAADLHVHTNYSPDGYLTLSQLDRVCLKRGIEVVAVTDHDEIAGALEGWRRCAAGKLRTRVIVGEEVRTTQGEIIGLFLKERVPPVMSLADTIQAIRSQGGLVYLNHPFGYARRSAQLSLSDLEDLWDKIDIIEIFNGRNRDQGANRQALKLALARRKPGGVGTDAHSAWEVGRSFVRMPDFEGPEAFLAGLYHASCVCRPCPHTYRVLFKARKILLSRPLPQWNCQ